MHDGTTSQIGRPASITSMHMRNALGCPGTSAQAPRHERTWASVSAYSRVHSPKTVRDTKSEASTSQTCLPLRAGPC
eukprot:1159763-Pelagomonas_calceolata.AAC.3